MDQDQADHAAPAQGEAAGGGATTPSGAAGRRRLTRRNAKGGVLVKNSDLACVEELFDSAGKGFIVASDITLVGRVFYPQLSDEDVRLMMNRRTKMTEEALAELLCDNDLVGYDPVEEAFAVLAGTADQGEGAAETPPPTIDAARLKDVLTRLGVKHVTLADVQALLTHADADGDGAVGLEDFRLMARMQ